MARSPEARAPKRPRTAPSGAAESAPPRAWSDHIRGQLEAEIDKLRPLPGARHALVLIGENAIVPRGRSSMQGFVIVDPDGRPRTVLRHGRTSPFRLADLAAELRERFPMLFEPGTVIGEAAPSGTAPIATRTVAPDEAEPGRVEGSDGGRRDPSVMETAGAHGAESHRIGGPDLLPRTTLFRPTHWVYAGLLLSAGAVLAYVVAGSGARTGGAPAAQADGGQGARPVVAEPSRPPASATAPATAPVTVPPPAPSAERSSIIAGVPEVVDTATLRLERKIVRLFGVEWDRGANAEDLTRYIAARPVVCEPVAGVDRHRCRIGGRDLSEVVLHNGGGRATADATPELRAAEETARANGFGVWQKR